MNGILAFGCALAAIVAASVSFAAPISAARTPAAVTGLELVQDLTMTVVMNGTQVMEEPVSFGKAISILDAGAKVTVMNTTANGAWAHVRANGVIGYVPVYALKSK